MKVVSVIPARGGSKGIPRKNIQDINGKPLIAYNIIASLGSNVDETWVSTDDKEIADISRSYGAQVLNRPEEFANDTASSESALLDFAEKINFDILVFLQCTSPLTTSIDINNSIEIYNDNRNDSVLSVCKDHGGWLCGGFTWEVDEYGAAGDYDIHNRPRRQNMNPRYRENGAIYITSKERLMKYKCRISGHIGLYEMPRQRSFEIDSYEDLKEIIFNVKNINN